MYELDYPSKLSVVRHLLVFSRQDNIRSQASSALTSGAAVPQVAGWDLYRKLTSRVANFLAHTLLSPGVTDLTGSYRLFTKSALEDIMKDVTSKGAVLGAVAVCR